METFFKGKSLVTALLVVGSLSAFILANGTFINDNNIDTKGTDFVPELKPKPSLHQHPISATNDDNNQQSWTLCAFESKGKLLDTVNRNTAHSVFVVDEETGYLYRELPVVLRQMYLPEWKKAVHQLHKNKQSLEQVRILVILGSYADCSTALYSSQLWGISYSVSQEQSTLAGFSNSTVIRFRRKIRRPFESK